MIRGLYTAATAMKVNTEKMNVTANNLANATTGGYKKDEIISRSFPDMLISAVNDPSIIASDRYVGEIGTGLHVQQSITTFTQGALSTTENKLDMAINGDGFYSVETDQGERYTRDGAFKVNSENFLVTKDGDYVLGEKGRIKLEGGDISVSQDGKISSNGKDVDSFKLVSFANNGDLRKQGNNLYMNYSAANGTVKSDATIMQGNKEISNVDITKEMVDLMSIYRNTETNQKIISMLDQVLSKTVSEVGKV